MENAINRPPNCLLQELETTSPPVLSAPPCNHPQFHPGNLQHPIAEPPPPYPSNATFLEPNAGGAPRLKNGYQRLTNDYPPEHQGDIHGASGLTTVVVTEPSVVRVMPYVNDHMNLSRFARRCCCPLIGIFAVMQSTEARIRYLSGDYYGAVSAAKKAKSLAIAAIICGIVVTIIVVIALVIFHPK